MNGTHFLACLKAPSLRSHNCISLHVVGIRVSNICALAPSFVCVVGIHVRFLSTRSVIISSALCRNSLPKCHKCQVLKVV